MSETRQDQSVTLLLGLVRAVPAIVLAIAFAWMAHFIRGNGGRAIDWGGPAFVAFLCGVGALSIVVRAVLKKSAPPKAGSKDKAPDVAEPAFDPDAALRRYLANRDERPLATEAEPEIPAPRPLFGRKLAP